MVWDIFVRGGLVMYPLLLCSLAALAVIIERALFFAALRRTEDDRARQISAFHRQMAAGEREAAGRILDGGDGPVFRVLRAGMAAADPGERARVIREKCALERRRLFAGLAVLDTIVTAAPLLGLLGTVLGILHTFDVLGGAPVVRTMENVANGIAEALITTAAGLCVALPALVALNYFARRAETAHEILERELSCFDPGLAQ